MIQPERQPTRLAPGEIDPVQPIDPTHPLTRGLEGLWLPLPRLTGGSRLYDLSAHGRHGDIISDPVWSNDPRTTNLGLGFDGVDDTADLQGSSFGLSSGEVTVWTWLIVNAGGNNWYLQADWGFSANQGILFGRDSQNNLDLYIGNDLQGAEVTGLTDRELQLHSVSSSGGVSRHFINGKLKNTVTGRDAIGGGGGDSYVASENGSKKYGADTYFAIGIHNIDRPDQWHKHLYDQARRGFPSLLNRRDQSALYVSGASGITVSRSDTATLQEVITDGIVGVNNRTDSLSINEVAANNIVTSRSISAALSLTEAVSDSLLVTTNRADGVTYTEEAASVLSALSASSDTVSLTDAAVADVNVTGVASVSAAILLNESIDSVVNVTGGVQNQLNVADLISERVDVLTAGSESFALASNEAQTADVGEGTTEGVTLSSALADTVLAADAVTPQTLSLSDSIVTTVQALDTASVSAAILLSENVTTQLDAVSSRIDTASLAEVIDDRIEITAGVQDDVEIIQTLAFFLAVSKSQSDSLGLFESVDAAATVRDNIDDNATFEEKVKQTISTFVSRSETFTLVEDIQSTEGILEVDLPDGRTLKINPEQRTYSISSESRIVNP